MKISVVIPVYNESENIPNLSEELRRVFYNANITWECIWVDDGSTDNTWQQIIKLAKPNRGIKLRINHGQATATMAGIDRSKYDYILTLDGDGQNDPKDIVNMIEILQTDSNCDLVQGFRVKREDDKFKRVIPSKIANFLVRIISGRKILDLGCSLRLFKKNLINDFRLTGEMHRLFTLYLLDSGAEIIQTPVTHRPRVAGVSNYGFARVLTLFTDIILYKALKRIFISPIYTFAKFAFKGYLLSFSLLLLAILLKISDFKNYIDGNLVSTSIVIFALSTIYIGLGLIAEMITRVLFQNSKSYHYTVAISHN